MQRQVAQFQNGPALDESSVMVLRSTTAENESAYPRLVDQNSSQCSAASPCNEGDARIAIANLNRPILHLTGVLQQVVCGKEVPSTHPGVLRFLRKKDPKFPSRYPRKVYRVCFNCLGPGATSTDT